MGNDRNALLFEYLIGGLLRYWLMLSEYQHIIAERVEVSTPLNDWKRVTEGVYLINEGITPFQGDTLHESPLHLYIYNFLIKNLGKWLPIVFIICDIITGHLLYLTAQNYMTRLRIQQKKEKSNYAKDVKRLLLHKHDFQIAPFYVATAYIFNPFTLFNCIGMTTTVFGNLFLALTFYTMLSRKYMLCSISLAICTTQSLYPLLLLSPLLLLLAVEKGKKTVISTMCLFTMAVGILIYISYMIERSWQFLDNVYGIILNVPDLRPNIGLFWYFFTEMFEHFRLLFICAFQINATLLYLVPLSIRFRTEPMLLATSLTALTATFKSYPCLGDIGFALALLPCWKHLFNYMQQGFLVGCNFLITAILGPIVWHLWIYSRSANANFYFGVTLAFATAQIFLITDILFAYIKREFSFKYGRIRKIDGKTAKLVLE